MQRDYCINCGRNVSSVTSDTCPFCDYKPILRVSFEEFLRFTQHRNDPAWEETMGPPRRSTAECITAGILVFSKIGVFLYSQK